MKKGIFRYSSLLVLILIFISCRQQKQPPNIIIFFTDDQGYADVGCFGAEGFETPYLDKLASEGVRFTDFYVPATVCTPSRAGLLTGKYPKRVGLHEAVIFPYSENGLSPDEYTMAEMLQKKGYATACIGKWHLGHKEKFMPNSQGFDHFFGVPYSNDMDNYYYKRLEFQSPPLPLYRNRELIEEGPDQSYLTKRYTEEAIQQIKGHNDQPFFIYLAHNMPHLPLHASPEFLGKSEKGLYGDVIMELDWSVGEIVKTLKEEGIYDQTLFIFTSDNGPRVGSALPLRGLKAETWEGGQRVPCIMAWPDVIPAGKICKELVSTLDLYPTFAEITGSDISDVLSLDGTDIGELMQDPESAWVQERPFYFYARNGEAEAVRVGKWKLHIKKSIGWDAGGKGVFPVSLYNLYEDVEEQKNVADQYPELVKQLTELIIEFDDL